MPAAALGPPNANGFGAANGDAKVLAAWPAGLPNSIGLSGVDEAGDADARAPNVLLATGAWGWPNTNGAAAGALAGVAARLIVLVAMSSLASRLERFSDGLLAVSRAGVFRPNENSG